MARSMILRGGRAWLLLVMASVMIGAAPARAGWFSDVYMGGAVTGDSTWKTNGVIQPPPVTCLTSCSTAKSLVGGVRVGYFFERMSWLGVAGDVSVFIPAWGIQSPLEVYAYPVSALAIARVPLVKQEGYPNGRVQPYLAAGPMMAISTATLNQGFAAIGTATRTSTTSVAGGFDGRAGIRILGSDWISFQLEYRLTYFAPSYSLGGNGISTSFWTNHLTVGFGILY